MCTCHIYTKSSDCTSWLAHSKDANCQPIWTCGTNYDKQLYAASTSLHCKEPLTEHNLPPKPTTPCKYNITSGQCQYVPGEPCIFNT